ncbi:MAG: ATP-binding protein [Chitinispirillia bacterium]|nr:ATP-binding protein [Chitinispirillia bacterium]MCL2268551.1 ATP-binding protein [Chitinispirillia bacterium]
MANFYIKRDIDNELLAWKAEEGRRVLLLRGARQVGKSSSVRKLGEDFEHFLEVNFERHEKARTLFDGDFEVKKISEELSSMFRIPVIPGKTLVFFDEIQSCPRAITALRYFYEDYPDLHVIAAGSLLEFALRTLPSFGVGRISPRYMYPLSYSEFLKACGNDMLWDAVCKASPEIPLPEPHHHICLDYLKRFLLLGGMPAVVADYLKNERILDTQKSLRDLMETYKSDFEKYKTAIPGLQIATVFKAAVEQSGGRFNHAKVEQLNYRQVREGLDVLQMAGLLIPVTHASANGIPLGGQINPKKMKYLLLDTGIFQNQAGLELSDILLGDAVTLINKGTIAEQFVGLELKKALADTLQNDLFFWSRETPKSNAEVDYLVQKQGKIIPIEVKSGGTGKMQSMHIFLKEKNAEFGIRTSLENFATYDKIKVYPLYAIGNFVREQHRNLPGIQ